MQKQKDLLKFITCGSVDDGKSTLIGHMLYDAKLLFADQKRALELDSKIGSTNGNIDYALLLDGLEAEREQGITIDVAYRFFSTEKRSFIVADTPGHEEYTRNMAVGASFAQLAIILIDASKGVLEQTRRHTHVCSLMGIKDFIFAVNKMDLVEYAQDVFNNINEQISHMLQGVKIHSVKILPVSAVEGDNLTTNSSRTPWYTEKALLPYLETVKTYHKPEQENMSSFCMPVQRVSRPNHHFRGFQGEIVSGEINIGTLVTVLPSREQAHITRIICAGKEVSKANTGSPITICLDKEIDISRGCVIVHEKNLHQGNSFVAKILWMDNDELNQGNQYYIQIGTNKVIAEIKKVLYSIKISDGSHVKTNSIHKNDLFLCELNLGIDVVFDEFEKTPAMGNFILVNRITHSTTACGIIEYALDEEGTVLKQDVSISRTMREKLNGHKAITIWFTGLSGSGKSTLADAVEKALFSSGIHTMLLDGDNVRIGLCKGLGFSDTDRSENIRRVAEVSKLLNDAGVTVIVALLSPFRGDREMARSIIGDSFLEVYVDASLNSCIERDVKGLYKKAMRGEIRNFTGISSPYEIPLSPDVVVRTDYDSINDCRDKILSIIRKHI